LCCKTVALQPSDTTVLAILHISFFISFYMISLFVYLFIYFVHFMNVREVEKRTGYRVSQKHKEIKHENSDQEANILKCT
jgi:hypothetical protein